MRLTSSSGFAALLVAGTLLGVGCDGAGSETHTDPGSDLDAGVSPDGGSRPDGGPWSQGVALPLPPGCSSTLDDTTAVGFYEAVRCIFEGEDPVQTGVEDDVITPERVAVLQGAIRDRQGNPLSGVRVRVLRESRYGETTTGPEGTYDLAVNGGGQITLCFEKDGLMRVQRHRDVENRRFVPFPSVVMMARNPVAGEVALDEMSGPVLVRGPMEHDSDGQRAHAVVFEPGTRAMAMMPSGEGIELTDLSVRVTEFTVGDQGPEAMPGDLPANSGYTYAVDLSVDEAEAMGAADLVFDPPLVNYVDNFLGFPAGTAVPLGFYKEEEDVWEAADSGVVIDIVDIVDGKAVLDIDADGSGDPLSTLSEYGIDEQELGLLAVRYERGQSLWRTQTPHFSFLDLNWGTTLPRDGIEPSADARTGGAEDCRTSESGSIIGCEDQTLGEVVPLSGAPFSLHYQSERMPGRRDTHEVEVALSGDSVPESLLGIELEVTVLGQVTRQHFEPAPNLKAVYRWDGRDAYGRAWQGRQPAMVRVGFTYPGQYAETARFSANPGLAISGSASRQEVTLWSLSEVHVGTVDATAMGMGGWSFSAQHLYDPLGGVLHRGDGRQRTSQRLGQRVVRLSGQGDETHTGDGGAAIDASFVSGADVVVASDGTLFFSDSDGHRVRRIQPDGAIDTYAGIGQPGISGDGGPADQAAVGSPEGLALAPDGTLYIVQRADKVVRAVAPSGTITTVAGGGTPEDGVGDGGPAIQAELVSPYGLALDATGTLYVSDLAEFTQDLRYASRVRAIDPDGTIRTVAGGGELRLVSYEGGALGILAGEQKPEEGIVATEADLVTPTSIVVDEEGSLYIAETDAHRIRKVTPDGRIHRFAGNGSGDFSGEGGRALEAGMRPWGMALDADGNLYFSDNENGRVRRIRPDGMIESVAGNGTVPTRERALEGGPALSTPLINPTGLRMDGEGRLLLIQNPSILTRIEDALPTFKHGESLVADASGALGFRFDALGRHLSTIDTLTGISLLDFEYNDAGLLVELTDRDGNATEIERDGDGDPTAIVGPYGQRTELTVDAQGMLTRIQNAAGGAYRFEYDEGGLLTAMTEPRSAEERHVYEYDDAGRLIRDEGPTGFYQTLSRQVTDTGVEVTRSERGVRQYRYTLERLGSDKVLRRQTDAAGLATRIETGAATIVETPTQKTTTTMDTDPRFGMQAQFPAVATMEIEGGPTRTIERRRQVELAERDNPLSVETYHESTAVNGRQTLMSYEATSRTRTTQSPMGRTTKVEQDEAGRPVRITTGSQEPVVYEYDDRGRVSQVSTGDRSVGYEYGSDGRVAAITDPLGQRVAFEYDAAGRPTKTILSDGTEVTSGYGPGGQLTSIAPPGRAEHVFTYAPGSLLTSYAPPALPDGDLADTETRYSYDSFDMLSELAPPGGDAIVMNYQDDTGRLLAQSFPRDTVMYGYDEATGQIASVRSRDATLNHTYTGPLPASVTWDGDVAGTVGFSYDDNLWMVARSVGDETVAYSYDDDGLVTQAGSQTVTRDPDNGWAVGTSLGQVRSTFRYSTYGELAEHQSAYGGSTLYMRQDTRDALGRVIARQETVQGESRSYEYGYDSNGRLETVTADGATTTYAYDDNGNRTQVTGGGKDAEASYDTQDRLVAYGDSEFGYTPQGSLAEKTAADGTTRYDYDLRGALRKVELPDGRTIEYLIDALGRRIGKRVDGTLTQGLLYQDALNPVAELDASGNVIRTFIYATRSHVPDYMVLGGTEYQLITDALGSVRLVVDVATGEVAQRIDYDEFGNVLLDTNPGFQPFGFAGGLYDADAGLVRFGARDYDPVVGRWTAKDPILFDDGTNLYAYVGNDPVNFIDPNGTDAWSAAGAFVEGAAWTVAGGLVVAAGLAAGTVTGGLIAAAVIAGGVAAGGIAVAELAAGRDISGRAIGTEEAVDRIAGLAGGAVAGGGLGMAGGRGYRFTAGRYEHGGGGMNVNRCGERVLGLDWHSFGLDGRQVNRPHWHYGSTKGQKKKHRPWQKPGGGGLRWPWE